MESYNNLPSDIVRYILAYDGRFKYRNGKYMTQISADDERYKLIKNIPEIYYFPYDTHVYGPRIFIRFSTQQHFLQKCLLEEPKDYKYTHTIENPSTIVTIHNTGENEYRFIKMKVHNEKYYFVLIIFASIVSFFIGFFGTALLIRS
jgi:hypothetical protein